MRGETLIFVCSYGCEVGPCNYTCLGLSSKKLPDHFKLRQRFISMNSNTLTLIIVVGGGGGRGQVEPCDAKFSEKCPCFHHNNTALIKQISLFDTALVIKKT